jgi:hypothetical protein
LAAAFAGAPVDVGARPVIGRSQALGTLRAAYNAAAQGQRRLVFVAGEPGVGKSTLLSAFMGSLGGSAVALGQCVEHYGAAEPYLPLLEALNALCTASPAALPVLRRVAPTWLLQMPWLLDDTDRAALQREVAGASQDRMLREMGVLLEHLAAQTQLLLVLEDLHWADAATVRLLDHLARRRSPARLLVLASFRPAELIAHDHPLGKLRRELRLHRLCEEVQLEGFNREQVAEFVAARLDGAPADAAFVDALERHTDGLPLFLGSVLDELHAQGQLQRSATGAWRLPAGDGQPLPLPHNLLGLAERQLQRLPDIQRRLLEAAALATMEFDHLLLAQALGLDATAVREQLDDLVQRQAWLRAGEPRTLPDGRIGARYRYAHALLRHACAHSVGAVARIELHRRLGAALEAVQGESAADVAHELALHAERGQEPARAAAWYALAAQRATQRIAPQEALALAEHGLLLLQPLPEGAARAAELPLLNTRIGALMVTQGFSTPAAASSLQRAQALTEAQPLSAATLPLWHAHWWALNNSGAWAATAALAARLRERAEVEGGALAEAVASVVSGLMAFFGNRYGDAIAALRHSLAVQQRFTANERAVPFVQDLAIECLCGLCVVLDAAARCDEAAAARADIESRIAAGVDPLSEAMGLWFMACSHQLRRDLPALRATCARALALMAARAALPGAGPHHATLGWGPVMSGELSDGLAALQVGQEHYARQGSVMGLAWFRASHAEAHLKAGDMAAAAAAMDVALQQSMETELCVLRAEVHRVHGALCWARRDGLAAAQPAWEQAINEARASGAPLLEVAALRELAQALAASGQVAQARERLAEGLQRTGPAGACPALQQAQAELAALQRMPT